MSVDDDAVTHRAHELAMEAKHIIFRAETAVEDISDDELRRVARRHLTAIRARLERLDRALTRPRCTHVPPIEHRTFCQGEHHG